MKYEDARRQRGAESAWLRLKFLFRPFSRRKAIWGDTRFLSDHIRCDIGLPEPVRYMDWRSLKTDVPFNLL